MTTAREIDRLAYEAISNEFGEDVPNDQVSAVIQDIVEHYRALEDRRCPANNL